MLNISREYGHNLNTAVVFFQGSISSTRMQLQWILHREWDLGAIPFGVLFCCLPFRHKSSLLRSWNLRPCLPSPGGNTIRCRGHFILCHCLSTAVIRFSVVVLFFLGKTGDYYIWTRIAKWLKRRKTSKEMRTQDETKSPELLVSEVI